MSEEISNKARGGFARAEILGPEKRSEIAKRGALARWGAQTLPRATHSGDMKISSEVSIPVYVLEDETRLITQRGLQTTIGMSTGGATTGAHRIAQFAEKIAIRANISNDLSARLKSPILFIPHHGGRPAYGYEATTLIDLCELLLLARDAKSITETQGVYVAAADVVIRAFAKVGIIAVIDEVTGYQAVRPKDALEAFLQKIVAKELAAWAKKFPDEFYMNIYKLKGWVWPGMQKNRFSVVAHYTTDLVYKRIAPGLLEELERKSPRNDNGDRRNKLHQWLTDDIGNPMLAQHMHSLIMFQRLAIASGFGWNRFLKMVDQVMPKRGNTLEIPFPEGNSSVPVLPEG
jgi:hypothetical protein